jgi:hypothetical protein
LFGIELLTFDFAGLQNIFGERFEDCFLLKAKAEAFHLPDEPTLPVTNRGQRLRNCSDILRVNAEKEGSNFRSLKLRDALECRRMPGTVEDCFFRPIQANG